MPVCNICIKKEKRALKELLDLSDYSDFDLIPQILTSQFCLCHREISRGGVDIYILQVKIELNFRTCKAELMGNV